MKKRIPVFCFVLVFIAEIVALTAFALKSPESSQDAVAVNEVVHWVTQNFNALNKYDNPTMLDFVVLDNDGNVIYKTRDNLSESINCAITHRDTILDVVTQNNTVGKVIIYNDGMKTLQSQKKKAVTVLSIAIAVSVATCIGYALYIRFTVVVPFGKLKGFAERIAGGNLDIPLAMDKQNIFGAFTESFDIMRSELKKARIAQAQAQQSKKELVAKLSHDIKTPIASIKAVSEVGLALTENEKDRANYARIIAKSDQINTLVTNLFTATLEELQQLTVSPEYIDSKKIAEMLENADYLHKANKAYIHECLVYADPLRLQQVFDNVFANSYKYAQTEIWVSTKKGDNTLNISIQDFGGGVTAEELLVIKEKFKRGSNAKNIEGAGLGLYISEYFMKEMKGNLTVENGATGLNVIVTLSLNYKN